MKKFKNKQSVKFIFRDGVVQVPFLPISNEFNNSAYTIGKLPNTDLPSGTVNLIDPKSIKIALSTLK